MKVELVDIDEIEDIIIAFANGELHKRLEISDKRDDRDTIVAGINMLGEELEKTTISRDYFMSIYNSVSDILIITNMEGNIVDLNLTTENTFGKKACQLIGSNLKTMIGKRFHYLENRLREAFSAGEVSMPFEATLEINETTEIPVSCTLSKIIDRFKNHSGYLFIAKDITERKLKETNDVKIAISSQERERRRLADDLHDSLGQEINAIRMYMNALAEMDKSSDEYLEAFETCKKIVDSSLESIRDISFDLMPRTLEEGSLIEAIDELVRKLKLVCNIDFSYSKTSYDLSIENKINLYRIVQEFVNNSMKHAGEASIEINMSINKKHIRLSIKDNGKGFEFSNLKYGKGIYNIKSRLKALGASYDFGSKLNEGTYLDLEINSVA